MKVFLCVLAAFSLLLNAYLVVREIDGSAGGGQHKQSPDMQHTVTVNSIKNLNPLSTDTEVKAVVTLHKGGIAYDRIRTFTVTPISGSSEMAYREIADPIEWSEDSKSATVTTPDFTLTINVQP